MSNKKGPYLRAPERRPAGVSPERESDWLDDVLRDLPREQASQDFTSNVLRAARLRADGDQENQASTDWLRMAYGGVALTAAVLLGFLLAPFLGFDAMPPSSQGTRPDLSARTASPPGAAVPVANDRGGVDSIRDELRSLRQELTELRQLRADVRPVAAIEGDDYDVVIDLRDFLSAVERSNGSVNGGERRSPETVPTMW